ncbi:type IV pilin protein [Vitiosangium sp. GDMCC 1.1324]|uniref:type IV pilin protein n=1 Tax=Vitiosangium sp. (strain GDMCC 1.1324) TaxID=2138576 RepID=UPI000D36EDDA|nr:prepilin-type N-terminal cleavage/methylation domain-containing protein [Vitiosangium sp. GDMCC 1.1324]PTL78154.1 hypothetical protein DAT35_41075 [Vitiosangium sp. GDMCC 1.1324]
MRRPTQRHSRGSTLIEVAIVLVMLGLLAVIAVPRFLSARSHAHQAEVRQNLKAWSQAQRSFYQEEARYEENIRTLGFTIERGNRYAYFFGSWLNCELRDTATPTVPDSGTVDCITVDRYVHGPDWAQLPVWPRFKATHTGPGAAPIDPGLGGSCPDCNISAIATGEIDGDLADVDTWYVSTGDAELSRTCGTEKTSVQAGKPFNVYDDIECDSF